METHDICVCRWAEGQVQVGCFVCMAIVSRLAQCRNTQSAYSVQISVGFMSRMFHVILCAHFNMVRAAFRSLSSIVSGLRSSQSKSYAFLFSFLERGFLFISQLVLPLVVDSTFGQCMCVFLCVCNREYKTARKPFFLLRKLKTCSKKYASKWQEMFKASHCNSTLFRSE